MPAKYTIPYNFASPRLLWLNVFVTLFYLSWWLWPGNSSNPILYWLLFGGEVYHVIMTLGFLYTVWPRSKVEPQSWSTQFNPPIFENITPQSVAIFITVAGEEVEVVEKTALAALNQTYPNTKVYILNDGFVADKANWQDIEKMAQRIGALCITRFKGGGAKAGNINHALQATSSDYIAILDADMVPFPHFIEKLMPHFTGEKVGFVQSPQYYGNHEANSIATGAWGQQRFFFGPIMIGKNSVNSAFICGTNVVIRRKALVEAGGMYEKSIAEDFLTSLFIHQKKWSSVYVPEVLCVGLAPEDLLSYYNQQHRWARGSLEVLFGANPLFKRGLTWGQRLQYLLSALYYCNGIVVIIDMVMPLFFLFFGLQAVAATTTSFAFFFIPYMFISLYTLFVVSGQNLTFRAMSFSQSSFMLQVSALFSVLLGRKTSFAVTAKHAQEGNYISLVYPHLIYTILAIVGTIYASSIHGLTPSVVTNSAWALFNIVMFLPFIKEGYNWKKTVSEVPKIEPVHVGLSRT